MNPALKYLKNKEWTMGNGQCPTCCGLQPDAGWEEQDEVFYAFVTDDMGTDPGRPMFVRAKGHKESCPLKEAIDWLEEFTA